MFNPHRWWLGAALLVAAASASCGGAAAVGGGSGGGGLGSGPPPPAPPPPPPPPSGPTFSITAVSPQDIMLGSNGRLIQIFGQGFPPAAQVTLDGAAITAVEPDPGEIDLVGLPGTVWTTPARHAIVVSGPGPGNSVSTYLDVYAPALGPSRWKSPSSFLIGGYQSGGVAPIIADINGDGNPDVVGNGNWMAGDGKGNLSLAQALQFAGPIAGVPDPSQSSPLAAADIDGDGSVDLILRFSAPACPAGSVALEAVLNNGTGTFRGTSLLCGPNVQFAYQGVVVDLNGDGQRELVMDAQPAGGGLNEILSLPLAKDGTLSPPRVLASGEEGGFQVVDLNGDGRQDLVFSGGVDFNQAVHGDQVLLNLADGFHPVAIPALAGVVGSIVAGDFNNDKVPDLLVQPYASHGYPNQVEVFLGAGDGTFAAAPVVTSLGQDAFSMYRFAAGDFNADGNLDLAGVNFETSPSHIEYLWGRSDGTFEPQQVLSDYGEYIAAGDMNRDGVADVVVGNRFATVSISLGLVGAHPDSSVLLREAGPPSASALVSGQLPSLLTPGGGTGGAPSHLYINNGDGTFAPPAPGPAEAFRLAEADGDDKADELGRDSSNHLLLWKGLGGGQFAAPLAISVGSGLVDDSLVITDLDGDGRPDIVGNGFILYGEGNDQFSLVSIPRSGVTLVGDFNGDGKKDLLLVETAQLMLGQGGRAFQTVRADVGGGSSDIVGTYTVGDFNGDGCDDVAAASFGSAVGDVRLYYGHPDGTLALGTVLALDDTAYQVATLPLGTGTPPAIVAGSNSNQSLTVFQLASPGHYSRSLAGAGVSPQSIVVADFDGDGHADVALGGYVLDYRPPALAVVFGH